MFTRTLCFALVMLEAHTHTHTHIHAHTTSAHSDRRSQNTNSRRSKHTKSCRSQHTNHRCSQHTNSSRCWEALSRLDDATNPPWMCQLYAAVSFDVMGECGSGGSGGGSNRRHDGNRGSGGTGDGNGSDGDGIGSNSSTGWRKPIGCFKLQDIFRKRATNYRALLRKMSYKDKASYDSKPPCSNGGDRDGDVDVSSNTISNTSRNASSNTIRNSNIGNSKIQRSLWTRLAVERVQQARALVGVQETRRLLRRLPLSVPPCLHTIMHSRATFLLHAISKSKSKQNGEWFTAKGSVLVTVKDGMKEGGVLSSAAVRAHLNLSRSTRVVGINWGLDPATGWGNYGLQLMNQLSKGHDLKVQNLKRQLCNALQHTATHCNTLQHTATHCNTLQHTATHCIYRVMCTPKAALQSLGMYSSAVTVWSVLNLVRRTLFILFVAH